jgi:hypothetical protein
MRDLIRKHGKRLDRCSECVEKPTVDAVEPAMSNFGTDEVIQIPIAFEQIPEVVVRRYRRAVDIEPNLRPIVIHPFRCDCHM